MYNFCFLGFATSSWKSYEKENRKVKGHGTGKISDGVENKGPRTIFSPDSKLVHQVVQ